MENQSAISTISYMLYADPLYKWVPDDEFGLNVLLIGQDEHTIECLDVCLQAGQMLNHALNITVFSQNPQELKRQYLATRPALAQFVNIDHSLEKENSESYGNLVFSEAEFLVDNKSASDVLIQDLLLYAAEQNSNEHIHYVFISQGQDDVNAQIASQISQAAVDLDMRCAVHFVVTAECEVPAGCAPVYVNKSIDTQVYRDLERIAFNVHLCWKGFHQTHVQEEWQRFRGTANWRDSFRFAVSIPYKLSDLGISVSPDLLSMANGLNKILCDPEKAEALYHLAFLEHRRWLLDKACSGWTAPSLAEGRADYSYCLAALSNHDDKKRVHNCICRSSASFPLLSWTEVMWDDPTVGVSDLDELDRSSIELHRFYQKAAARLSADSIENTASLIAIRRSIPDTAVDLRNCYDHFCLCIKSIIDGSVGYAKRYTDYESKLVKKAGLVSADCMKAVQTSLPAVKRMMFPAIQRNLYVDYKKIDLKLIREIPFILTYKQPAHLIVGIQDLQDSSTDIALHCIASATAVRPQSVTYLITATEASSPELLLGKLEAMQQFLVAQLGSVKIVLTIAFLGSKTTEAQKVYYALHSGLGDLHQRYSWIEYRLERCEDAEAIKSFFTSNISEYSDAILDGSNAFFASNLRNASFLIEQMGVFPYIEYDFVHRKFSTTTTYPCAAFIHDDSSMHTSDMFTLMGAHIISTVYPAYAAVYPKLRDIYLGVSTKITFSKSVRAWNILVAQMAKAASRSGNNRSYTVSFDENELRDGVKIYDIESILKALFKAGILKNPPALVSGSTFTFQISTEKYLGIFEKEGNMLEIYTFFEACASGAFDDVSTGLKFSWMKTDADSIDRTSGITVRYIQAVEALETGDYDTAEAILSGDQWKKDIIAADSRIDLAEGIKKKAEETIDYEIEQIRQEIISQRLRIDLIKARGINNESASVIKGIYETIVGIAERRNIEPDVIVDYASFLADQADYKGAIEIADMVLKRGERLHSSSICRLMVVLGKSCRYRNELDACCHYGEELLSIAESINHSDPLYLWCIAEGNLLKEAGLGAGNPDIKRLGKTVTKAVESLIGIDRLRAIHLHFDAQYFSILGDRELALVTANPTLYAQTKKKFEKILQEIRKEYHDEPVSFAQTMGIWLNSYANLLKKGHELNLDVDGYQLALEIRREAYTLFEQLYETNRSKYARDYALSCQTLGNLLRSIYSLDQSKHYHSISHEIFTALYDYDPNGSFADYAEECQNYAHVLIDLGLNIEAEQIIRDGLQICDGLYGAQPDFSQRNFSCSARLYQRLSESLIEQGRIGEAIKYRSLMDKAYASANPLENSFGSAGESIQPLTYLYTFPMELTWHRIKEYDTGSLVDAFDSLEEKMIGRNTDSQTMLIARSICLIAERLLEVNPDRYAIEYSYYCMILATNENSITKEQRLCLIHNSLFAIDRVPEQCSLESRKLICQLLQELTQFERMNHRFSTSETVLWHEWLYAKSLEKYRTALEAESDYSNTENICQEMSLAYSRAASAALSDQKYGDAIRFLIRHKSVIFEYRIAHPEINLILANADLSIVSILGTYLPENTGFDKMELLKEAEELLLVCPALNETDSVKLANVYKEMAIIMHDTGDAFNSTMYANKALQAIKDCKVIRKNEIGKYTDEIKSALQKRGIRVQQPVVASSAISVPPTSHYRKIQKLKARGLTLSEVVQKLHLSKAVVEQNWERRE